MAQTKKRRRKSSNRTRAMTQQAWNWVAIGLGAAALAAVLVILALLRNEWLFSFYPALSRAALKGIAWVTGFCPLAVGELAIPVLLIWAAATLIRAVRNRRKLQWLCGLLAGISVGVSAFIILWGINHLGPTIDQKLGLEKREYSVEELTEAAVFYLKDANEWSAQVARSEDGTVKLDSFDDLASAAGQGYAVLAETEPMFRGSLAKPKKLLSWKLMNWFGNTGIFVCLTGESCVNQDTDAASLPFTMCHEIGHRMAVAAEDEANFCAYLACRAHPDFQFRYSGAYCAFLYCYNALYKVSPKTAAALWERADSGVRADCEAAGAHYAKYEGAVQDAAQKVNDTYLKAFQETSGIQSYGEVADLLIALYFAEK